MGEIDRNRDDRKSLGSGKKRGEAISPASRGTRGAAWALPLSLPHPDRFHETEKLRQVPTSPFPNALERRFQRSTRCASVCSV